MYSLSTKAEYATDITLGRIVRFKKLSSATQKRCKKFVFAGASTTYRLVVFSATFGYCLVGILCLSVSLLIIMENYTNSEMTDMVGILRTLINCTFFDRRQTQKLVWRELICRDTTVFSIT
jgi:hypothetical protein